MRTASPAGSASSRAEDVSDPNVDIDEDALLSQAVLMPNVKVGKGAKIYRAIVADGVKIDDGAVVGSPDSEEIVLISKRVKKGE